MHDREGHIDPPSFLDECANAKTVSTVMDVRTIMYLRVAIEEGLDAVDDDEARTNSRGCFLEEVVGRQKVASCGNRIKE